MGEKARQHEEKRRANKVAPNNREHTYVGMIDLKQAYDRVNRQILILQMAKEGLPEETIVATAKIMENTSFSMTQSEEIQTLDS